MFDKEQLREIARQYIQAKNGWSVFNDLLMFWAPRRPLMQFSHPEYAAQYILGRYTYKNDLVGGLFDHHLHHTRLQAQLETGAIAVPWQSFDCDKVASWFYATIRNHPEVVQARLITLISAVDPNPLKLMEPSNWGHHTICGIQLKNGQFYVLDVNGYQPVLNLNEQTLCDYWTQIYWKLGYKYLVEVDVPYPW